MLNPKYKNEAEKTYTNLIITLKATVSKCEHRIKKKF